MKRVVRLLFGALFLIFGVWFALIPGFISARHVFFDRGLSGDGPSSFAIRTHHHLSKKYPKYVRERIESGAATTLHVDQIGATEWPLFGSCFYLWATESLQEQWEKYPDRFPGEPRVYAEEAIEAAKDLVIDPGHAKWVEDHWGGDYLHDENCFYRMLVIGALTSHANLTGSREHHPLLRDQVESLSTEISESPFGLIDDYPKQCYPTDVVAAIATIARADQVLGTDHSEFIQRSLRGFSGERAGPYGLPPYGADAGSGTPFDHSRGCGNSYFLTFAPTVWPERASEWYGAYDQHFWQAGWFAAGIKEFPDRPESLYYDVDAGPVLNNLGTAATAFGTGAARTNGRFDHARTLSTELIVTSWPLPGGRLIIPRVFSSGFSQKHAPLLGEAAIAFQLSREPYEGAVITSGGSYLPGCVWLILFVYLFVGWISTKLGYRLLKKALIGSTSEPASPTPDE